MFLWRVVIAEPPLCSAADLNRLSLDDLADLHEALDLREELNRKAMAAAQKR